VTVPRRVPTQLWKFLAPFPDVVQSTALALRKRVLAVMPAAHETVWDAVNAVSLAYSDSERGVAVCHVATFSKHVNLGFNEGASMSDPFGLLAGTGTHIRHVTLKYLADTHADWIDDYLLEALRAVGLTPTMGDRGTTVRVMQGRKRRPG
jgi:hypothetical protein